MLWICGGASLTSNPKLFVHILLEKNIAIKLGMHCLSVKEFQLLRKNFIILFSTFIQSWPYYIVSTLA